jgi:hypothetical protein
VSNIAYTEFFPEILPYFPGIPEALAINAVRNAAIEFCNRTDWLLYTPILQDLIAYEDEYDLTLDVPTDHTVSRVQAVWVSDMQVMPRSEDELRRIYNLDWRKQTGRPLYYTQYTPETLVLVPFTTSNYSQALATTLVIRPTRDSTTCDSSLHERWVEEISYGARMRLHEAAGHAYENPQLAEKYRVLFSQGIDRAIIERTRGLSRTNMRVRPPRVY